MKQESGAARIFWYNWPVFVGTWTGAGVLVLLRSSFPAAAPWLALAAAGAVLWSLVSLAVSLYVYNLSSLAGGRWIAPLLPPTMHTWAMVHAGLDAELALDAVLPGRCLARLDIFDARFMTAPSIHRARRRTAPTQAVVSCSPLALSLADAACDVVIIAFTAHEVRARSAREQLFAELRRSVRPGGRVLLVEHLRDFANFLAFGPGCLHFLPLREWRRCAAHAELAVVSEQRITPWVMALLLERRA